MFKGFTESYTGTDASGEIFFMLLVMFILGYLARWAYERIMFEDFYEDENHMINNNVVINEAPVQPAAQAPKEQVTPQVVVETPAQPIAQVPVQPTAQAPAQIVTQQVHTTVAQDDLKIIEGVGPKIESLLKEGGIDTLYTLSKTDADDIKTLLRAAGERYRIHDPSTWPEQAELASEGKMDELKEFQDALSGGKDLTKIYK